MKTLYIQQVSETDLAFKVFATITSPRHFIWKIFRKLINELPEEVFVSFYDKETELEYESGYLDKQDIIERLDALSDAILNNVSLEVSVCYFEEGHHETICISPAKYIEYYGMSERKFRQAIKEFRLLEVVNNFPVINRLQSSLKAVDYDVQEEFFSLLPEIFPPEDQDGYYEQKVEVDIASWFSIN